MTEWIAARLGGSEKGGPFWAGFRFGDEGLRVKGFGVWDFRV